MSAFQYFENVRNFLVAVQEMGLPTFEASDLEQVRLFLEICFGTIYITVWVTQGERKAKLHKLRIKIFVSTLIFAGRKDFKDCELCFGTKVIC